MTATPQGTARKPWSYRLSIKAAGHCSRIAFIECLVRVTAAIVVQHQSALSSDYKAPAQPVWKTMSLWRFQKLEAL